MGFWTGVRLPSIPLGLKYTNPIQGAYLGCFKNIFGIIFDIMWQLPVEDVNSEDYSLSFGHIRKWIETNYGVRVSNGSISSVVKKSGMKSLKDDVHIVPFLSTEKEKMVFEAISYFKKQ